MASTLDCYIGSLVGMSSVPIISECAAVNIDLVGHTYLGGLVGWAEDCTITNCFAAGEIESRGDAAGLVSVASGTIENCYFTGFVESWPGQYTAGLVYDVPSSSAALEIISCYFDQEVSGLEGNGYGDENNRRDDAASHL